MDLINECLSLSPPPYLAPALSAFKFIWLDVRAAQVSQRQLEALARSVAQLLVALDRECRAGRQLQIGAGTPLTNLCRLLEDISAFVQKVESSPFLKLLFTKDQRNARIEVYYRLMISSVESFQISASLDTSAWQATNDDARIADQRALNDRLHQLENNKQWLKDMLNTHGSSVMTMIVSLQRRLDNRFDGDQERQFFSHVLRYLTTSSGIQVELQNWMITSYDVEFGQKIGSGGFGQVFHGTWNNTQVAIKVLATEAGVKPNSAIIRQEINTWSMLRHIHILQFLGANEFDDRPFIVMPYMSNGNARDYASGHPDCDRLQIFHHISLGLVYLHTHNIVHGDLKALNVLIDGSGKAVLCDFGLSRIKADTSSRSMVKSDGGGIGGSRNWMAPERLITGSLKKPCDIYAFGMTIYEIFANEIPLGYINPADWLDLVIERNVRPERPDDEDAPQLSDAVWEVAEQCWAKDPKRRPTANALCDILSHLLDTATAAWSLTPGCPASTPSSITSNVQPPAVPQLHIAEEPSLNQRPTANVIPNTFNLPETTASTTPVVALPASMPSLCASVKHGSDCPLSASPTLTLRGHMDTVCCAMFSPDRKYIVSGSFDATIIVWDAHTGNLALGPLKKHSNTVLSVAFSPDGGRIASSSWDNTILVWDVVSGKVIAGNFNERTGTIRCVSFSPDGKQIVSGSYDSKIRVWDARTGDLLVGPLNGHTMCINSVSFSGDGTRLVSGSADMTVRVWDAQSGKLIHGILEGNTLSISSVAFSPNGQRIVSVQLEGDVCVWDTDTGLLVSGPSKQHASGTLTVGSTSSSMDRCAVSPNGKWIVVVGPQNTVQVWNSRTGLLTASFLDHTHIYCVSFSPDSKWILSTSWDKTIQVYTVDF